MKNMKKEEVIKQHLSNIKYNMVKEFEKKNAGRCDCPKCGYYFGDNPNYPEYCPGCGEYTGCPECGEDFGSFEEATVSRRDDVTVVCSNKCAGVPKEESDQKLLLYNKILDEFKIKLDMRDVKHMRLVEMEQLYNKLKMVG